MLPRSTDYYASRQLRHTRRVPWLPRAKGASEVKPSSYQEELGVFVRLWLVILAGVAVILLGSWLATHANRDARQNGAPSSLETVK